MGVGGHVGSRWSSGVVRASCEAGTLTIALEGNLDALTGSSLLEILCSELLDQPDRVDIDLRVLDSFTTDGSHALARCRDLCGSLSGGLHYVTEGGAGQLALLAAFEHEPEVDAIS